MNENKLKARWLKEDEFAIESAINKTILDPEGRKFLWWLLQIGQIGSQPMRGNALNTAFACGELNVGQQVLDRIISVSPEGYLTMMKESNDERRERDNQLDGDRDGDFDDKSGDGAEQDRGNEN